MRRKIGVIVFLTMLACLRGQAELVAQYDFSDGDLFDNELGSSYTLSQKQSGSGSVTLGSVDGVSTAVFTGGRSSFAWLEAAGLGNVTDFTVSFWFRTDQVDQGEEYLGLFSSGDGTGTGNWQLHSATSVAGQFVAKDGDNANVSFPFTHSPNTWYHVLIRKKTGADNPTQFYVTPLGGTVSGATALSTSSSLTLAKIKIGVNRNNNQSYRMQVANVKIYNDSLLAPATLVAEGPAPSSTAASIAGFSADDKYVQPGENVELSWSTLNADSLSISPSIGTVSGASGSTTVAVSTTTTYTLTATKGSDSVTKSVTVKVGPAKPNLLVLLVDDFGTCDISVPFNVDANGNLQTYNFNTFYQTPNMEALAEQGMRFTSAYAHSVCSPTRCGLMTGRNSVRHGVTDWVGSPDETVPAWRMDGITATDMTIPKQLQDNGYRTVHVGKAHFGAVDVTQHGFDVNIGGGEWGSPSGGYTGGYASVLPGLSDHTEFLTQALAIEANEQLENAVTDGVPLFLNMCFYAVHTPWATNPNATGDYSLAVNADHAMYATLVEGVDIAIGSIMAKLKALDMADDTLIVFLGDNGSYNPAVTSGYAVDYFSDWPLRGKKASKYEGGSRVPMIIAWGEADANNPLQADLNIAANSLEQDIVTSWDIPATLLDIAGLTPVGNYCEDSYSLKDYLRGVDGTHRPQQIVLHYPHQHTSSYFSWVRDGDMKLIYNYANNTHELYDLKNDPSESTNIAGDYPETTMILSRALAQHIDATWEETAPLYPPQSVIDAAPMPGNIVSILNDSSIDIDEDGTPDTSEDTNLNGLVDSGETDPDVVEGVVGPDGYTYAASEGQTVDFFNPVDLAYGADGQFNYINSFTGTVTFDNATFGDPLPGAKKYGFYKAVAADNEFIDNQSTALTYSGTWSDQNNSADYAGSMSWSQTAGDYVEYTFNGTFVKVGVRKGGSGGICDIYIDGTLVADNIDTYSAAQINQVVIYEATLSAGSHTVRLEATGQKNALSNAANIMFDFFFVDSVVADKIENSSTLVTYTGAWSTQSGTTDSGGSMTWSKTSGDNASCTFTGSRVAVAVRTGFYGGVCDVKLDGVTVANDVDTFSDPAVTEVIVYDSGTIANGQHTIELVVDGTENIMFDYFYIEK